MVPEQTEASGKIRNRDRESPASPRHFPAVIVLDRLRSAFNVGNIFRLAEALRAEKIVACGYTAIPPNPKLAKTARGCDELVACEHCQDVTIAALQLKEAGYAVYIVETAEGASSIWAAAFKFPAAFIFGNEALGVAPAVLELCDGIVELPCFGRKNSLNVGNCAAVVLYEAARQWRRRPSEAD